MVRRLPLAAAATAVAAMVAAALPAPAPAANSRPVTLPSVRDWRGGEGTFAVRRGSRVVVPRAQRRRLRPEARLLAADLRRVTGRPVRVRVQRRRRLRRGDVGLALRRRRRPALGGEGYRIAIGRAVRIGANRRAGLFYGGRTLLQLLRQGPAPRGRARDWPRYPERGLMVDVGRKYFTVDWLRSHIRELAWLKLNYLHLHLSDNQGFRVESEGHPEIVSDPHLTKAEVRRLIALAARHHITVVPEIDMPGHMQAALAPHPELQLRSAAGTPSPANLDYTKPEAREFAYELVREYLALFPGPYWHAGADEYLITVPGFQTPADYAAYPQLEQYARDRYGPGATAKDGILGFVESVGELVRSRGKTLRIWHDGLEGGSVVKVDPRTVIDWWIDTQGPTPRELVDAGHRVMNAGWFPTYYVQGPFAAYRPDMRTAYESWEVHEFYGPFVYDETLQNPPETLERGEPLGSKVHVWNDEPEAQTEEEIAAGIAPRLRVVAQKTWDAPLLTEAYGEFRRLTEPLGHTPGWTVAEP